MLISVIFILSFVLSRKVVDEIEDFIVHAPYIINLGNTEKEETFSLEKTGSAQKAVLQIYSLIKE